MTCAAITEATAQLSAMWAQPPDGGALVPVGRPSLAFAAALSASAVLARHGWSYRPVVPIRHLATMLDYEARSDSCG